MLWRNGLVAVAVVVIASAASVAHADEPDVDALIAIVKAKPAKMSVEDWREKRRDAARELGRLGDKKAVPVLIDVVRAEKFDVVAEIAIEALGRLRDQRAVPVLREVVDDTSRDKYVREAAKAALKRIGVKPVGNGNGGGDGDKKVDEDLVSLGGGGTSDGGGSILGDDARHNIPAGPTFDDDVLSAVERLTFAAGNVGLSYDTVTENASVIGDARGAYEKIVEKQAVAWSYGVAADVALGTIDPGGEDNSYTSGSFNVLANGEARTYFSGSPFYGQAALAVGWHGALVRDANDDPNLSELRNSQEGSIGLAIGRGRVLEVGEGLRLRRLEQVLAEARMLGRPITGDLAAKLLRTWWALRGEQGAHRRLLATVSILRDAGVLLGEPDAGTTYKILQVLLDGQLDRRIEGMDVRIGFAESYERLEDDAPGNFLFEDRYEAVYAYARYGKQLQNAKSELVGSGFATKRVLAQDDAFAPWSATAELTWRRYFYGDAWDPLGALEFTGAAGLSDVGEPDGVMEIDASSRIEGRIGWAWAPARATRYRLSGSVRLENQEMFVGVTFDGTWGLLDAGYLAGGGLPGTFQ